MERYLVKMQMPPPDSQDTAYSIEGMQGSRMKSSLLDRVRRNENERDAKRARVASAVCRAEQDAERYAREERERQQAEENKPPPPSPPKRKQDGSFDIITTTLTERVIYAEDCSGECVPEHTNELCKWDLQPIDGAPFPIPVRVDERTGKIWVVGFTCSVSCALALMPERSDHILLLARDYFGAKYSSKLTRAAPPRDKLSKLYSDHVKAGTPNPLEAATAEFRMGSEKVHTRYYTYPMPPFVRVTRRIDEEVRERISKERHAQRLELMAQNPRPIACTTRGMQEQRKYVLAKRTGAAAPRQGAIDALLGISYIEKDDDDE